MTENTNNRKKILGWNKMIQFAPQAIFTFDVHDRIVQWNDRCQELFGYSWQEVSGTRLTELILPEIWAGAFKQELSRFSELTPEHPYLLLVTQGKNKNGREFALKMNIFKIQVNNEPLFTSFVDQTPSKEEPTSALPAVELMKQLGHDVKNALTSIQLLTQIALRNKELELAPHIKDFLTKIDSQSVKLGGLVNDLLDISRMQSDRLMIKKQGIDFKPFWDDVLVKSRSLLEVVTLTGQEAPAIQIDLDPFRIRQAISCILEHGKKHIEGLQCVTMETEIQAGELKIRIYFEHPVFEGHDQIFVGFDPLLAPPDISPLDPTMFISARSIELHQGTTSVQRNPKGGTMVSFTLPV